MLAAPVCSIGLGGHSLQIDCQTLRPCARSSTLHRAKLQAVAIAMASLMPLWPVRLWPIEAAFLSTAALASCFAWKLRALTNLFKSSGYVDRYVSHKLSRKIFRLLQKEPTVSEIAKSRRSQNLHEGNLQ